MPDASTHQIENHRHIGNAVATIVISKWEGALDKSWLDSVLADRSPASARVVAP